MLVRVKDSLVENFYGFYGTKRRYPGQQFKLEPRKTQDGQTVSVEEQFSERWMEKVDKRKREHREEAEQSELS